MAPIYIQLIIGLATPLVTLFGVIIANSKSNALMQYKIEELASKVNKHNSLIERTYEVEKRLDVIDEKLHEIEKNMH